MGFTISGVAILATALLLFIKITEGGRSKKIVTHYCKWKYEENEKGKGIERKETSMKNLIQENWCVINGSSYGSVYVHRSICYQ